MDKTLKVILENTINSQAMLRVVLFEIAELKSKNEGNGDTSKKHFDEIMDKVNGQREVIIAQAQNEF